MTRSIVERLRAELREAELAFRRIVQGPAPKPMREIAKARAYHIRQLLGCDKHGAPFITPDVCPFCAEEDDATLAKLKDQDHD